MTAPAPRRSQEFTERADAMSVFVKAAGTAPKLLPAEDGSGLSLFNALAALQWTSEIGLFQPTDCLHAAWFLGETAATVIEREIDGKAVFRYLGPRVETLQLQPAAGARSIDEPFVKGFDFNERWSALAHFFVTTQGKGALASIDSVKGVSVEHIRRWLTELFQGALPDGMDHLQGVWATATGAGFLFAPAEFADGRKRAWIYMELGAPHF